MFTITNKLRTIIALSAVGATLAGGGVAAAVSQAAPPTLPNWLMKPPMGGATCPGGYSPGAR